MTSTYTDLQNAIARELLNRTDLTTEIQAAIGSAILHYQRKKFWFSEEHVSLTTANATSSTAVPTDFGYIDGITMTYSTYPVPMERRDWLTMQQLYVNSTQLTGPPTDYAVYENKIWWWPCPNGAYTATLWQNFKNAAPVNGTDSNNWTTDAEELIRSRSVADIQIHVLKKQDALQEFAQVAGLGFFSGREKIAFDSLMAETVMRSSSGKVKPIDF